MPKSSSKNRNARRIARSRETFPPAREAPNQKQSSTRTPSPLADRRASKTPETPHFGKAIPKAEHRVRLGSGRTIEITGLRDADGNRYILCRERNRQVLTRYADWHAGGADASATLRRHGMVIVGNIGPIREAVDQIKRFRKASIVTRSGWFDGGFALPDGRFLMPKGVADPLRAFEPAHGMLTHGGTLEGWITSVAGPLAEHQFAAFLMMVMFAPPLLRLTRRADNFGVEVCGEAGTGKSTLQLLIASAAGPATSGDGTTYWRTMNSTVNALEADLPYYHDLPLILDEAGLAPGGAKLEARAAAFRDLAFRVGAGGAKRRLGEPRGAMSRLIYVLSTNVPIASMSASLGAESEAIMDRLITLPLLADRPHGIFEFRPLSYPTTGAFADALKAGAAEHYGHALPAFLEKLVERERRKPGVLQQRVQMCIDEFIKRCGANANDGSQKRVAEAFGLVYAAGRLAKDAGVLPASYRPGRAALAAYRLHRAHGRPVVSFDDRLRALLADPSTIDLAQTPFASLQADQVERCSAFIYTGKTGRRELAIPVKRIELVFPDWHGLKKDPEFDERLLKSSDRLTRDRPLGSNGKKEAMYCFNIMDLEA